MKMIRIFIADDHGLVRDGIRSFVSEMKNYEVAGESADGNDALAKILELRPDLAIVDISMPGLTGVGLTKNLSELAPEVKVLILSMHSSEEYIYSALQAGASGYVLKDADKEEIQLAIQKIAGGETYCGKLVSDILINSFVKTKGKKASPESSHVSLLSKRELEIIKLIAKGMSNKEIANSLFISTRTVDAHRYNIMQKIQARNAAELVMYAVNNKLVD